MPCVLTTSERMRAVRAGGAVHDVYIAGAHVSPDITLLDSSSYRGPALPGCAFCGRRLLIRVYTNAYLFTQLTVLIIDLDRAPRQTLRYRARHLRYSL